jgi:hypothetical protein
MSNHVDAKIDEITQAHVAESEKACVSRNVEETARRIKEALTEFTFMDVLASGYWEGLHDQAKLWAVRAAVLELAAPKKSKGVALVSPEGDVMVVPVNEGGTDEVVEVPKKKSVRGTKGTALA